MLKICNACGQEKEHKSWKAYTCNECLDKGLKYCPSCCNVCYIDNFHKNGHTIRSFCKECENKRSIANKIANCYYDRPKVRSKRNEDSRLCKKAQYLFNEEYRIAELIRCHERRELVSENTIKPSEWLETVKAFKYSCAYCGDKTNLTMDHVVPISRGGKTTIDNVVPACVSCNSSKQAKDVVEWLSTQVFYSKDKLENILKFIRTRR